MVNERLKLICLIIAAVALSAIFASSTEANTNFARKSQEVKVEVVEQATAKPAEQADIPCCPNPEACAPEEENPAETRSLVGKIGDSIARSTNRFLAFGCRVNHGFLNWVLADKCEKCDPDAGRHNCP